MTIWKFPLRLTNKQTVYMPHGAKILTLQRQRSAVCIWALVDPNETSQACTVLMLGTGFTVPEDISSLYKYIGSIQSDDGQYIWHYWISETLT